MALFLVFLVAVGTAALIVNLFASIATYQNTRRIMSQADDLNTAAAAIVAAIAKMKTDTVTALTDIANKLATLAATQQDPAVTAAVTSAIGILNQGASDLNAIDTSIEAADPGSAAPPPPPPPPVDNPPVV